MGIAETLYYVRRCSLESRDKKGEGWGGGSEREREGYKRGLVVQEWEGGERGEE